MKTLSFYVFGLVANLVLCDLFNVTNPYISWFYFYQLVLGGN